MDVVRAVRVRQLLRRVVAYLGEDQRRERRRLRRRRGRALGEDGGVVRYARAGQMAVNDCDDDDARNATWSTTY